jgi:hypothetical protein
MSVQLLAHRNNGMNFLGPKIYKLKNTGPLNFAQNDLFTMLGIMHNILLMRVKSSLKESKDKTSKFQEKPK